MPDGVIATVRQLVLVVVAFAVVGALAGVVWEWVWTPPEGVAYQGEWLLDIDGLRSDFSSTGLYVVIGTAAGLLTGALVGVVFPHREVASLVGVVLGSALAAWLMLRVGHALGPPDPRPLAAAADDYVRFPSDLRVVGRSPWVALPSGALSGWLVCLIITFHRAVPASPVSQASRG